MRTEHWVRITPAGAVIDGQPLATTATGAELLTELYRSRVGDYPKFYKMDGLSRLGFIAAELLLQAAGGDDSVDNSRRAVILFGRSGSVSNDRHYQQTIGTASDDFFPSPSLFVYTLPNIVTGEIAIRHHYHGETAFYLLPHRDDTMMRQVVLAAMTDGQAQSVVSGWVDYDGDEAFEAEVGVNVEF